MKKEVIASIFLMALAMTVLIAPAYAFDISPLTLSFDVNIANWSVNLNSVTVSWSSAHVKGTLSLTTSLITIVFQQGSTVTDLKIQGPAQVTLSGVHSFTGAVKIHLDGTTPQIEVTGFQIS